MAKALFAALYEGDEDAVTAAIWDGADVNACEDGLSGYTPLTLALETGANDKLVRALVDNGADVQLANAWGATPLLSALSVKNVQWAQMFLARGASVNVRGMLEGRLSSPLHEAAYWGLHEMLVWLMEAGGNKDMRAHRGMRPFEYARTNDEHSPVDLAKVSKALTTKAHPVFSMWREQTVITNVKWESIESMEHNGPNWTMRWSEAMKRRDWHNALLAAEMGGIVPSDVVEKLHEKRYATLPAPLSAPPEREREK